MLDSSSSTEFPSIRNNRGIRIELKIVQVYAGAHIQQKFGGGVSYVLGPTFIVIVKLIKKPTILNRAGYTRTGEIKAFRLMPQCLIHGSSTQPSK